MSTKYSYLDSLDHVKLHPVVNIIDRLSSVISEFYISLSI